MLNLMGKKIFTILKVTLKDCVYLYQIRVEYSIHINPLAGDKNISKLHLPCRTSDLTIFIRRANMCTCPLKAYAIKNMRE